MVPGPTVDTVIFDLGNVLLFHDNEHLFARLADRGGAPVERVRDGVNALWDPINRGELDRDGIRREVGGLLEKPLSNEEFFSLWNCHFTVNTEILPHVERLFGRVKVALLSNTNGLHIDYVREQLPILQRFDELLLSYELHMAKPDPSIFEEALRRTGTPANRAAFFDDIESYVLAAEAVGIQGRLFARTEDFPGQLKKLGL